MEGHGQPCWVPLSHVCLEIHQTTCSHGSVSAFPTRKIIAPICRAAHVLESPEEAQDMAHWPWQSMSDTHFS
jgi:hypothetical protein